MTQQSEAQRLADELDAYHTAPHHKQAAAELRRLEHNNQLLTNALMKACDHKEAAAELRRLEAEVERKAAGIKFLWQECDNQERINAQLLEALRDMVNTMTDGPDESDIARVFSVARAALMAAKGEA